MSSTSQSQGVMHFGFQSYKPSDSYTGIKKIKPTSNLEPIEEEQTFFNQQKLNEKFSF